MTRCHQPASAGRPTPCTPIEKLCDRRVIESWGKNAGPWTRAVREQQIDRRRQVTDQANVEAVLSRSPKTVLDIGCGEGWLAVN